MIVSYYTFQGNSPTQSEGLKLAIFPSRETIYICSSKTDFKFVDVSDKVYESEEEKKKCLAMSQEEYDATMIKTFIALGYKFIKKETDEKEDGG